jgi:hypothetical protein
MSHGTRESRLKFTVERQCFVSIACVPARLQSRGQDQKLLHVHSKWKKKERVIVSGIAMILDRGASTLHSTSSSATATFKITVLQFDFRLKSLLSFGFRSSSSMHNYGFQWSAESNFDNCPTFLQTLQPPSSGWICNGCLLYMRLQKCPAVT